MILIYQNKRKPPEVFISYCWQNSKQAEAKNTVIKNRKSLGAVDPRDIKDFLTEKKLSCWLDIERIGTVSILRLDDSRIYIEDRHCEYPYHHKCRIYKDDRQSGYSYHHEGWIYRELRHCEYPYYHKVGI